MLRHKKQAPHSPLIPLPPFLHLQPAKNRLQMQIAETGGQPACPASLPKKDCLKQTADAVIIPGPEMDFTDKICYNEQRLNNKIWIIDCRRQPKVERGKQFSNKLLNRCYVLFD